MTCQCFGYQIGALTLGPGLHAALYDVLEAVVELFEHRHLRAGLGQSLLLGPAGGSNDTAARGTHDLLSDLVANGAPNQTSATPYAAAAEASSSTAHAPAVTDNIIIIYEA